MGRMPMSRRAFMHMSGSLCAGGQPSRRGCEVVGDTKGTGASRRPFQAGYKLQKMKNVVAEVLAAHYQRGPVPAGPRLPLEPT